MLMPNICLSVESQWMWQSGWTTHLYKHRPGPSNHAKGVGQRVHRRLDSPFEKKADKSALFDGVCVISKENMISLWFECRFSLESGCSPGSFDASTSHQGDCCGCTSCDNHGNQLDGADTNRCVCASVD